jgi:hypothetical protein
MKVINIYIFYLLKIKKKMVICFRCQINISEFECQICNGFYCAECDKFIHSKKPKNNHIRKHLQIPCNTYNENIKMEIPLDFEPNLKYNKTDIHLNNNNNLQENKEKEKEEEQKIISQTYQIGQSNNNNNNVNENNLENNEQQQQNEEINEINYNNDNNNYLCQNMNNCLDSINNIMNEEFIYKPDEKDIEIKSLQKQIEEQRALINNLKQENNNLEKKIEETNSQLDTLYQEKERLINKKRAINEFYTDKQNEIEKIHELDKYKLIEDYEDQMREISQNYLDKKTEYIQGMQEIDDKTKEINNEKEEEKRAMWDEIDRLKNEGNNIDKETEYLTKSNEELNNKLKETSNSIDLLRANTLGNSTSKLKGKKKNKSKTN